jgi:hypothetical protein
MAEHEETPDAPVPPPAVGLLADAPPGFAESVLSRACPGCGRFFGHYEGCSIQPQRPAWHSIVDGIWP